VENGDEQMLGGCICITSSLKTANLPGGWDSWQATCGRQANHSTAVKGGAGNQVVTAVCCAGIIREVCSEQCRQGWLDPSLYMLQLPTTRAKVAAWSL
jgi:hypothetical protein